jgi:hypothetical protein
MKRNRKNFHCNFRAPDREWFDVWLRFKEKTRGLGLDICYVALSLCRIWLEEKRSEDSAFELKSKQIVFLTQTNNFNYNVQRPRRVPDCSKNYSKCTICSKAFSAYILITAKDLDREFCFRDFPELEHGYFRKLILQLRQKGKVLAMHPRALPAFYILPDWRDRYQTMTENNIVTPEALSNSKRVCIAGDQNVA